jgi:glycosyltransferase involved in cell wall biosynthesis
MPIAAPHAVAGRKPAEARPAARVVLSHPGTGPFVQHAARALHEAGLLSEYVTTFHYDRESPLGSFLRTAMGMVKRNAEQELLRRAITEVPREMVRSHPLPELIRMAAVKGTNPIATDRVWEVTEKWFDRIVARHHLDGTDAVYAYEHAALATFQAQKARGGLCFYDMPICHHATIRRWVGGEYERFPELSTSYERHRIALAGKRNLRKDAELALADRVIAASKFVRDSLVDAGVAPERIWQLPSGAPPVDTATRGPDPHKFVFVMAGHLSARKGTHYLLEAWSKLAAPAGVELWLFGNWQLPDKMMQALPANVIFTPTIPRAELYARFDRANVLVFPTLAEGMALTPLQAMARGLPVITTPNSGCETFIRSGENGWLVPPCDAEALASAMECALAGRADTEAMGRAAAETVARWQWSDYRAALGAAVSRFLNEAGTRPRMPNHLSTAAEKG